MILFLIISIAYAATLLLVKPAPTSLKAKTFTFLQNLKQVKAALVLGELLIVIFYVITDFSFIKINENLYRTFSLPGGFNLNKLWFLQSITHLFIHLNFIHIVSNVSVLGLMSIYERRVGSTRFLKVLTASSIASIPSALFYSSESTICGISGGIFGLAAAHFTDQKAITTKEWLQAIIFFIVIVAALSFADGLKSSNISDSFQVDYLGHILGAIGGIVYCKLKPS